MTFTSISGHPVCQPWEGSSSLGFIVQDSGTKEGEKGIYMATRSLSHIPNYYALLLILL